MRTPIISIAVPVALLALSMSACSRGNAHSQDQAVTAAVQNKLNSDTSLAGAGVTASTLNGVVTLTGTVNSEAARVQAAQDAQLPGVTQVNNQIATNTPTEGSAMVAARPAPAPSSAAGRTTPRAAEAAPERITAAAPVEVESGTALHVRLDRSLSSATASVGESFSGTLTAPILVNGETAIPKGATVNGSVSSADSAGHFKGQSRLGLTVNSIEYDGRHYDVTTSSVVKLAGSRTTRSEEAIGGGAGLGAIIGAIAGHGKGAAIGAVSGAGAGTAVQALTKPPEVEYPAETILRFSLKAPVQVVPGGE